jgi:hypothetical protein
MASAFIVRARARIVAGAKVIPGRDHRGHRCPASGVAATLCCVTTKADFAQDEWDRLVRLPRLVVAAASAAQRDIAYRTTAEVEAGLVASARGRESRNAFVAAVAAEALRVFDDRSTLDGVSFADVESGIIAVLDRAAEANDTLREKASPADAAAYRAWLVKVADVVVSAARTGGFLGFGGRRVTEAERRFRDRLAAVLLQE